LLPPNTAPPPVVPLPPETAWEPFEDRAAFDFAHHHFVKVQSSKADIDTALDLWQASILKYNGRVPWRNADELHSTIDAIQHSGAPWEVHEIHYQGPLPPGTPPKWMTQTYELCARNTQKVLKDQLCTSDFRDQIDLTPYRQYDGRRRRVWSNLMSADWAWKQAVRY